MGNLRTCLCLAKVFLMRELVVVKKDVFSTLINFIIWPVMAALIYGFVLPALGVPESYGGFVLVGIVVATWIYTTYEYSIELSNDLAGNRRIDYELTLPVKPQFILCKYGVAFAFHTLIFSLPLLFIGGLFLGDRFSFARFSFIGYFCMNVLGSLVFAFFALWVCAWSSPRFFLHIRVRLYDPLFFLGCYMSSYAVMEKVLPTVSRFMLLNPVTHAMEATRVMVFGQEGYINVWWSLLFLIGSLLLWGWASLYAMRKRLDYVKV